MKLEGGIARGRPIGSCPGLDERFLATPFHEALEVARLRQVPNLTSCASGRPLDTPLQGIRGSHPSGDCDARHELAVSSRGRVGILTWPSQPSLAPSWKVERRATTLGAGLPWPSRAAAPESPRGQSIGAGDGLPPGIVSGSRSKRGEGTPIALSAARSRSGRWWTTPTTARALATKTLARPHPEYEACVPCHDFKGVTSQQVSIPGPAGPRR